MGLQEVRHRISATSEVQRVWVVQVTAGELVGQVQNLHDLQTLGLLTFVLEVLASRRLPPRTSRFLVRRNVGRLVRDRVVFHGRHTAYGKIFLPAELDPVIYFVIDSVPRPLQAVDGTVHVCHVAATDVFEVRLVSRLDQRTATEARGLVATEIRVVPIDGSLHHRKPDRSKGIPVLMGVLHPLQQVLCRADHRVRLTLGICFRDDVDDARGLPHKLNAGQPHGRCVLPIPLGQDKLVVIRRVVDELGLRLVALVFVKHTVDLLPQGRIVFLDRPELQLVFKSSGQRQRRTRDLAVHGYAIKYALRGQSSDDGSG